jgi:quinol monooxygenase YgiN
LPVIALLELQLKPDSIDTGLAVIHETLAGTRAFAGCQGVSVLVDSNDPAHVILYETWEPAGHDRVYREWRAGPGASSLGSVVVTPPRLSYYTVAEGV